MNTNKEKLVKIAVSGIIKHPRLPRGFEVLRDGTSDNILGIGGIVYNVKLGDSVFGWAADHVEPGVSGFNGEDDEGDSFSILSCIGNRVRVLNGEAKGAIGFVYGKHGGVQHVLCHFNDEDMVLMAIGDKLQIETYGTGMKLTDYKEIHVHNIDPAFFEHIQIKEKNGALHIPVTGIVPSYLIGSGFGDTINVRGRDCDWMTCDWNEVEKNKLEDLKLGDIVLISDLDSRYGRQRYVGMASVGVVIHGDSMLAGHGPGIATFMSGPSEILKASIDKDSNVLKYYGKAFGKLPKLNK